jgi:hypothetical protein
MKRFLGLAVLMLLCAPQVAQAAGDRVLFVSNRADGARELYLVDRDGSALQRLTFNDIFETQPIWSPDRSRIVFAGRRDGVFDLYTIAADGTDLRQVTTGVEQENFPKWTSDGRIVFMRGPLACPCRPWIVNADGSGLAELPLRGNVLTLEPSPHGRKIVYATDVDGGFALHVARLDGGRDRAITDGSSFDFNARWSPNGNQIAFLRDTTGSDNDVYVVKSNGNELRRLTDTSERVEFFPAWSSDGSEVLFGSGAGDLYAVSLEDGSETPVSTNPRAPFAEDFGDGRRESSFWHQISDAGSTIGEVDGELVVSIAGDAVPGGPFNHIAAHWGSQCQLAGDFDYQVDYELRAWPLQGGFFASLSAFFGDAAITRSSGPWEPYQWYGGWRGGPDYTSSFLPTSDLAGTLRLVRVNGTIFAYARSAGGSWILIFTAGGVTGVSTVGIGLATPAEQFGHEDGSVAFDDFKLSSGELSCPTWWGDLAPDVY